jgi:hypothetical protein
MSEAFEYRQGRAYGLFGLGRQTLTTDTSENPIAGDMIIARVEANVRLCLLGIDAPELSLPLPGCETFVPTNHPDWEAFLADPFSPNLPVLPVEPGLRANLLARIGSRCGENHHKHALAASRGLETEIAVDLAATGKRPEDFRFKVRFEREAIDAYGRLLGWISIEDTPDWRPLTYNHRMMLKGLAMPYYIWPNVSPFRFAPDLRSAVPMPGSIARIAEEDHRLARSRAWFQANRESGVGVFDDEDPLRLHAFELRYLSQRKLPDRWVIDLSRNDDVLLHPQHYYQIEQPEDRLFVPDEYLELFLAKGWRAEAYRNSYEP